MSISVENNRIGNRIPLCIQCDTAAAGRKVFHGCFILIACAAAVCFGVPFDKGIPCADISVGIQ